MIDNDIRYQTDPRTGASTDMLGIVAHNNITIKDNTATSGTSNFTVHAALFSYLSAIDVENLNSRPLGTLYSFGGWTVQDIHATTNSGITKGLSVNIQFDERFRTSAPPFFPTTNAYEILAWYE